MKRIFSILIIILVISTFSTTNTANAHTNCKAGSEKSGWVVNCKRHSGKKSITFSYAPGLLATYKTAATTGASRWTNTGIVSIKYNPRR